MLRNIYYIFCNLYNKICFKRKKVKLGNDVQFYGKIRLCGNGLIEIGNNVRIISDWQANPIGGEYTVFNMGG